MSEQVWPVCASVLAHRLGRDRDVRKVRALLKSAGCPLVNKRWHVSAEMGAWVAEKMGVVLDA